MKRELINTIVANFSDSAIDPNEMVNRLILIFKDYEVKPAETAIVAREENENEYLIDRFILHKQVKGCTERTLRYYRTELRKILLIKIHKSVKEINADDITLYLAQREYVDGTSRTTCDNELRCLRTFFNWLRIEEIVIKNPCEKIERIKHKGKKKEAFTEMEIEDLRFACRSYKEKAIIEILLATGCRVSELVQIKISDINGNELIVHGKGEKDRKVYLTAKAQKAIEVYLNERNDKNPFLFPKMLCITVQKKVGSPKDSYKMAENICNEGHMDKSSIEQTVRRLKKRAGVKEAYPHKFRRTCATLALRRGMPIEQVSKMLGHEQLSTTQIYLDLNEEDLKMAHSKYVG